MINIKRAVKAFFAARKVEKALEKGLSGNVQKQSIKAAELYQGIAQSLAKNIEGIDASQIDACILEIYRQNKGDIIRLALKASNVIDHVAKLQEEINDVIGRVVELGDNVVANPNAVAIVDQLLRGYNGYMADVQDMSEKYFTDIPASGTDNSQETTQYTCPKCGVEMSQIDGALWECKDCNLVWDVSKDMPAVDEPSHKE